MIKMDGCQEASFQRSEIYLIIQEISSSADRLNRITQLPQRLDREKTLERGLKYLKLRDGMGGMPSLLGFGGRGSKANQLSCKCHVTDCSGAEGKLHSTLLIKQI